MLNLRNEFIMAPVKLGYSDKSGEVNEKHLQFYEERCRHIGAITPEPLYMDPRLRELPSQLGIDSDKKNKGLIKLNAIIHLQGAKSIAHLNHPGRMANPKIPGNIFWSATAEACENGGAQPTEMNEAQMQEVIDLFVNSAKRAVKVGFDIIEIQFGHGYLMSQFLSPAVNNRTDEYGGSFENRKKYPLMLAKAVREAIGVPLIARISGDEMIPQGLHPEETFSFAKELEDMGYQAIHMSAGSACSTPPWFFQHMFIPKGKTWELAGKLQKQLNIPVIFVGKINKTEDVKLIKEKYHAKYLAVGRAMVADPNFVGKITGKINRLIRPCLACAEGCLGGVKAGKGLGCVVNPLVNTPLKKVIPENEIKRYAVVGGGLAGMQAAITLRDRGYDVDLYEKDKLGGQFNLAFLPPHKESLQEIIQYYINDLKNHQAHQVNIINKEADAEIIKEGKYQGVIMASGAVPTVPPIKGLKEYYWTEFLEDNQLPKNSKVLVIGGGLIGMEVASKLVDANNEVVIVEMLEEIARGMEMIEKAVTLKKLKAKNTLILTKHQVIEINGKKAIIKSSEGIQSIDHIDKIVVATGMKPYKAFEKTAHTPVYTIGDAQQVGKAQDAIYQAYKLAAEI